MRPGSSGRLTCQGWGASRGIKGGSAPLARSYRGPDNVAGPLLGHLNPALAVVSWCWCLRCGASRSSSQRQGQSHGGGRLNGMHDGSCQRGPKGGFFSFFIIHSRTNSTFSGHCLIDERTSSHLEWLPSFQCKSALLS